MQQNLIKALISAQQGFKPILKNKKNPAFKSRYADLDSVLEAVTPALAKNGLGITQLIQWQDGSSVLETRLYHESGEFIASTYPLPNEQNAQKMGSAITYARRYALCAMLSVTADDDDDGNASSKPDDRQAIIEATTADFNALGFTEAEAIKLVLDLYGVKSRTYLGIEQLKDLRQRLLAMKQQRQNAEAS